MQNDQSARGFRSHLDNPERYVAAARSSKGGDAESAPGLCTGIQVLMSLVTSGMLEVADASMSIGPWKAPLSNDFLTGPVSSEFLRGVGASEGTSCALYRVGLLLQTVGTKISSSCAIRTRHRLAAVSVQAAMSHIHSIKAMVGNAGSWISARCCRVIQALARARVGIWICKTDATSWPIGAESRAVWLDCSCSAYLVYLKWKLCKKALTCHTCQMCSRQACAPKTLRGSSHAIVQAASS